MIFYSQPWVEHTLGEKRTVMQNNFTFHKTSVFSLNVFSLNTFLNQKWNKGLLQDNKSWEPLDATVGCMDQFSQLWGLMFVKMWN